MINDDDDSRKLRFNVNAYTLFFRHDLSPCVIIALLMPPFSCYCCLSNCFGQILYQRYRLNWRHWNWPFISSGFWNHLKFQEHSKSLICEKDSRVLYYWFHYAFGFWSKYICCAMYSCFAHGEGWGCFHTYDMCLYQPHIYCLRISQLWRARVLSWFVFGSGVALHAKICFSVLGKTFHSL